MEDVLKNLAAGYFEFSKDRKVLFYRSAREKLAHLWVEIECGRAKHPESAKALAQKICQEIMPAISGVLRKIEGKAAPRNSRTREE